MIYKVTAEVEGDLFVRSPFAIDWKQYHISLQAGDESDRVTSISIGAKLEDFKQYMPLLDESLDPIRINIKENLVKREIIELLRHLESLGGYVIDLRKICWEYASEEWIPETEEEHEILKVRQYSRVPAPRREIPRTITPEYLWHMVENYTEFEDMVIPLAFFREGRNEYETNQYVNSFYKFYFFLEDLYGSGKSRNRDVIISFQQSESLRKAIQATIDLYSTRLSPERNKKLLEMLDERSLPVGVDEVMEAIVLMRGNLHHFSQKSSLKKAHPFNQESFERDAHLLMSICHMCLVDIVSDRAPALGQLLQSTQV